jgi:uncharacterized protein YejL (UPF0352 family)
VARQLVVEIVADASKFSKGIGQAESKMGKVSKAAGIAGAAITGAFVVGMKKSVDAAKEAQVSQSAMETQLKALGISYKAHAGQIDQVIQSTSKLAALDDEDLQNAFTRLTRSTGDVNKGLRDTKIAADVARGANISLEAATKAVSGVETGRITGLKKLGIEVDKHTTKQEAIAALQEKFAGASEAYGKTAAGSQERLGVATENLEESMGTILLPTIEKVAGAMANLAGFFEKHKTLTEALIIVVGALGGALLAVNVATTLVSAATKIYTAAQWLLNAALDANPIGLVIIALTALGVALVIAWKKSETFREIVTGTWNAIKTGAQAVLNFFRSNWPIIATLISGPFAPLVALATNAFGVRTAIEEAFRKIKTFVGDRVGDIVTFVTGIPDKISGVGPALTKAFTGLGSALAGVLKAPINAVIGLWNKIGIPPIHIKLPGPIPDINFGGISLPDIPQLAQGGIVTRPTLAMIGESGPEAVVPLTGGGGQAVTVNVGSVTSPAMVDLVASRVMQRLAYG